MYTYRGKTALITGASSGIGEAFAYALAARGMNVILVARSEAVLNALAQKLAQQYNVQAVVLAADLRQEEAVATIKKGVQERDLTVDLLVNNAGFGNYGRFERLDEQRDRDEVLVNVAAVVDLTHAFLPSMVARGEGAIINIASLASYQPITYMAVYGASKAFVLSFSQALWAEYRKSGIRIVAICPGPVATKFFQAVGSNKPALGMKVTRERVVAEGLRGLEQGRSYVIPGRLNSIVATFSRLSPRQLTARVVERILRPRRTR